MKKLIMILIAFATLQISAQEQKKELRKQHMKSQMSFSPAQIAQLQTKKMTLKLDLSDQQQKEVSTLFLENAKLRPIKKASSEPNAWSKEERFQMANARLDQRIEMKKKMKTILSSEQFEKWAQMTENRKNHSKRYGMHHKTKKEGMRR